MRAPTGKRGQDARLRRDAPAGDGRGPGGPPARRLPGAGRPGRPPAPRAGRALRRRGRHGDRPPARVGAPRPLGPGHAHGPTPGSPAASTASTAPVYVASPDVLAATVGFDLHRGAVAAADRRPLPAVAEVLAGARCVAVLEGLNDAENLGAIARSARALGVDALVLDPTCIDPYYRRIVRVSMGEVLLLPIARATGWPGDLDDDPGRRVQRCGPHPRPGRREPLGPRRARPRGARCSAPRGPGCRRRRSPRPTAGSGSRSTRRSTRSTSGTRRRSPSPPSPALVTKLVDRPRDFVTKAHRASTSRYLSRPADRTPR